MNYPQRIICMTEETVELLYLMGEQHRIVGVSGYTVRPPQARKEKPKISAFTSAKIPKILDLKPDLVLGFSDMQADIAADLVRHGLEVHIFNQRTINGIFAMITTLGALIGEPEKAQRLIEGYQQRIEQVKSTTAVWDVKPKVYFEEWYDPMINAIGWVGELIEVAGGINCFPELSRQPGGKERIIADPQALVSANPDIIIGSWCGRKFRPEKVSSRPGWERIAAVIHNDLYEIKSAEILQPGPAALTDGLDQLYGLFCAWQHRHH